MPTFISDIPQSSRAAVPYFEDSQAMDVPGRGLKLSVMRYQAEIVDLLDKLGAGAVRFTGGCLDSQPARYAYQIDFSMVGANGLALPGRILCAALPMRSEAPKKKDRAMAQALYVLGLKLQAMVHAYIYEPDSLPLVPYLTGPNGQTVTEALMAYQSLPMGDGQHGNVLALPAGGGDKR